MKFEEAVNEILEENNDTPLKVQLISWKELVKKYPHPINALGEEIADEVEIHKGFTFDNFIYTIIPKDRIIEVYPSNNKSEVIWRKNGNKNNTYILPRKIIKKIF